MERKKLILIIALVAVVLVGVIGGTIAYFSNNSELKNKFIADTLNMEAIEDFTSPDNWLPGETTEKKVRAKNTTKLQMAVRISYTEHWEDREGNILPDSFDGEKAAIINFVNEDDWIPETKNDVTYSYYYKLLNPEEMTSDFMESVTFNKNAIGDVVCTPREDGRGEECKMSTDYEDATYYLNIKIEMIAFDKYKENWDTSVDISEEGRPTIYDKLKNEGIIDNIKSEYVEAETGIDFSGNSTHINGKGIYLRAGTENDEYPIYYYRGDVQDNNVLFGGFCWKIVRTTETGGIKLLYNGVPNDTNESGMCNNTKDASEIGKASWYSNTRSPAYVGYMRGVQQVIDTETAASTTDYESKRFGTTDTTIYGNDVIYSEGTYTLVSTKVGADATHHYTCMDTRVSCEQVAYVYKVSGSQPYYLLLSSGENIEGAKEKMFSNKYDSKIKQVIDEWFRVNLDHYSDFLEDAVWCNDRTIVSGGLLSNNSEIGDTYFSGVHENGRGFQTVNSRPGLKNVDACPNKNDRFTVNDTINGNGNLTYKVGLLTADEAIVAGSSTHGNAPIVYINNNQAYWSLTPEYFHDNIARVLSPFAGLTANNVSVALGVRPAISLKNRTYYRDGDGTAANPYVILANPKTN